MRNEHHDKIRLDRLLVERGLADTRTKAQAMILAGEVLVDEQKVEKCGALTSAKAKLRLVGEPLKYVSREGLKQGKLLLIASRSQSTSRCCELTALLPGRKKPSRSA
jgi:23S rRNA (cytidine1920-2'-O)/16S rRNA (cytidine1409-2'-O)-methyltransferase